MRIIFLNTWNATLENPIRAFITEQAPTADVFCLQEADTAMKRICEELLPDYQLVSTSKRADDDEFPQATCVRNSLPIEQSGGVLENELMVGIGLFTKIKVGDTNVNIGNFHGIVRPGDKLDTPKRLAQSKGILPQCYSTGIVTFANSSSGVSNSIWTWWTSGTSC